MNRQLFVLILLLCSPAALAAPRRYGVFIGSNHGYATETDLRYAEGEAGRMAEIFRRLGGASPDGTVLFTGESADRVRAGLISVNERIRRDMHDGHEVMLFVYYSGHADADDLHLGRSSFPIHELRQLVRGSAATMRILVSDSCRSGAFTRVKGGKPTEPFDIRVDDRLDSEGTAIITSSAATEDSQESDELRGSIFTHYFASALLGAADTSGDDQVTLGEAYRYAYENTLRYTSHSGGTQHPTFQLDVRGKQEVVLTQLALGDGELSTLRFGEAGHYFVFKDSEAGAVVAEVLSERVDLKLVLRPGTYFVRRRDSGSLYEGSILLGRGRAVTVARNQLRRVAYAQLVRKGGSDRTMAQAVGIYYRARGETVSGLGPMQIIGLRYAAAFPSLTLASRLGYGRSSASNSMLESSSAELELAAEAARALDWRRFTLSLGVEVGGVWMHRSFVTTGLAPDRDALGLLAGIVGSVQLTLGEAYWLSVGGEAVAYVLRARGVAGDEHVETPLTGAVVATFGRNF